MKEGVERGEKAKLGKGQYESSMDKDSKKKQMEVEESVLELCYDDEDAEELDVDFEMDFGGEGGSEIRLRCCDDGGCC